MTCGTQARGAAARSNAPDSEARAARSTTTDSTSDPRAVPITSPLAAAGEAEELWMDRSTTTEATTKLARL